MLMRFKCTLVAACILLTGLGAFAQSRVGLSLYVNKTAQTDITPSAGLSFERPLGKRSTIEVGLSYRSAVDTGLRYYYRPDAMYLEGYNVTYAVTQKTLSLPLLYTYHTPVAELSVGATADFFLGWKEKSRRVERSGFRPTYIDPSTSPPLFILDNREIERLVQGPMPSYHFDHPVLFGVMVRAAKKIRLNEQLSLEPALYYNPVLTPYSAYDGYKSTRRQFYGASASVKYAL